MDEELLNILTKVHALYRRYGIRSVTMDDVARELGISKKTLYQHVRDKDDLVEKAVDMEISRKQDMFSGVHRKYGNAVEELITISQCIGNVIRDYNPSTEFDLKKYYPQQYEKIKAFRRDHIFNNILDNLKRGKREGLYRGEINEEIISKISVAYLDCMIENELFSSDDFYNPEFFREFFSYHLHGIVSDEGAKILKNLMDEQGRHE